MTPQDDFLLKFSQHPNLMGSYFETKLENGVGKLCFVGVAGNVTIDGNNIVLHVKKISNLRDGQLIELEPSCCIEGKIKNVRDLDFSYRLAPDDVYGREKKLLFSLTVDLADDKKNNIRDSTVYFFPNLINHGPVNNLPIVFVS